jgi:holo-[acyl-carrier protein] synthase
MKIRIGIDMQSIDDVEASLTAFGSRYLERVYTRHEIDSSCDDVRLTAVGLANRFAAKEAVMKLLDVSDTPLPWKAIEVQMSPVGRPTISLSGVAAERARRQGVDRLSVSLSHTDRLATAIVVGEFTEREYQGSGRR